MSEFLIFGHKSPDTDSICASLVMEKFNKNNGIDAKAVRLGELNKETKYVLEKLGIEAPRLIEKVENGQQVILVDHNSFSESVNNIENAKIEMVVDHHKLSGIVTAEPLYYLAE
ncbi:MAG: manganese-dependent inorganic pyrophosphatase, partial [Bacilli bacterium]|nr:manganese-dependent inorganic pyrophosphatase [Bacilli bacterium]